MATDFNETPGAARYKKPGGSSLGQMWKNPIFKLVVVLGVGGAAAFAAMQFLSKPPEKEQSVLPVAQAPSNVTDNTDVTPEYMRAVNQLDQQRVEEARATGVSSLPTPLQNPVAAPTVDTEIMAQGASDPLRNFENIINNGGRSNSAGGLNGNAAPQPVAPPVSPEEVQNLSRAMRTQVDQLIGQWQPEQMKVTMGTALRETNASAQGSGSSRADGADQGRLIVSAGSVYYGQMLMEANSDIPGPIMAQVLTGPFAGGRAIGSFETYRDHLAIHFKTIAIRNREFPVDILALDPNTTLGGVVTEVDPRYFTRVLMPAAAAFIRAYGETISEPASTTTVSGSGSSSVTTNDQQQNDSRDALYKGLSSAAERVGSFVDEEASATKRLVRVAVGTPVGLFFVSSVREGQAN